MSYPGELETGHVVGWFRCLAVGGEIDVLCFFLFYDIYYLFIYVYIRIFFGISIYIYISRYIIHRDHYNTIVSTERGRDGTDISVLLIASI